MDLKSQKLKKKKKKKHFIFMFSKNAKMHHFQKKNVNCSRMSHMSTLFFSKNDTGYIAQRILPG